MKQRFLSIFISALIFVGLFTNNAALAQSSYVSTTSLIAIAEGVEASEPDIATPEISTALEAPEVPTTPEISTALEAPEVPTTPEISTALEAPEVPTTPEISTALEAPEVPTTPETSVAKAPDESSSLLKQLETEILPQIESVLTPEQQAEFASKIAAGTTFRKAFKAVTLTPAQKTKLSTVFKSIPKKDIFATLTPAQKKQLFLKNKQLFIPSSEEIGAKITAGMQMAKDKSPLAPSAESIVEKINAKMKAIEVEK
ncbi:MAG: hypothetical protein DCF19_18090 [Pseudanabaena frigida]|uniref:DUF3106 domain-containing protein n=1 Tax=Pseudanabaena frigida TaxID=945775 RepID=A0A2W4XT20_9CYAN|nr:MAG: hypothetical protein DCF19_18090 [Pseudanabaena frigida]